MKTALVCFAVKEEAGEFRKLAAGREDIATLVTGIGRVNSEKSLGDWLSKNSAALVLTCGFAGGLNPELKIGDVVFETEDDALRRSLAGAGARESKIFCAPRVATTAEEKGELRRTTGADAVEMESQFIRALCRARGIRSATVRVVSDAAGDDLPLDFNKLSKPDQSLDFTKLAAALLKQPGKIPALLRLQKNCAFAAARLAEVLGKVLLKP